MPQNWRQLGAIDSVGTGSRAQSGTRGRPNGGQPAPAVQLAPAIETAPAVRAAPDRSSTRQPAATRANPCQHGKTATIEKTGFGPDRTSGSLARNRHQCLKERCPVKTIAT
ncbi:MAG: hypothetical protein DESF_00264 [Desulfovibrio sp.]